MLIKIQIFFRRNCGGNYDEQSSVASKIDSFKSLLRVPEDRSIKNEEIKRRKSMMNNIHAIEKQKNDNRQRYLHQINYSSHLSTPRFTNLQKSASLNKTGFLNFNRAKEEGGSMTLRNSLEPIQNKLVQNVHPFFRINRCGANRSNHIMLP